MADELLEGGVVDRGAEGVSGDGRLRIAQVAQVEVRVDEEFAEVAAGGQGGQSAG